ncbi:MAG TPA: alanine racemase [Gemmatimonadaceae bacterium]|nr:alanine racemase [Gemmatimonadaceae bacterium]
MHLETLETPVPIVDLDRLTHNLDRMAAYVTVHGLRLRPHVKTHKAPRVATEQLQRGAIGLTCATPQELEIMAEVCDDLLLAHPPVGAARLERLMRLPDHVQLTVAVDSAESLPALGLAARLARRDVSVVVEVDLGMRRVGVSGADAAITLARAVRETDALDFAGMLFYPGHIREGGDAQSRGLARLTADVSQLIERLHDAGLPPRVVSGGSTPLAWRMHEVAGVTEVRPGTYVYNDRTTAAIGACDWDDCALTVLATVVSTAVPGQAVVDAGSKALAREPLRADGDGWAAVLDHPTVRVTRMSEEHGILDLSDSDWRPRVGDRVRLVPNHVCLVVQQFDEIVGVRGETVETTWPVAARGRGRIALPMDVGPRRPRVI